MIKKTLLAALLGATGILHADVVVNFDDLSLPSDSYHNNSAFQSSGAGFNNSYTVDPPYTFWAGFSYSNVTDHTTGGFTNQYASAAASSGIYAVGYVDTFNGFLPTITLPLNATQPISISITNTAYAYDAIKNVPTTSFSEGDWFLLKIEGKDSSNQTIGFIDFYLADYRSENSTDWYVLNTWTSVDLTSLGSNVASLSFNLTSSDTGIWGMNTPAYFAMDNLVLVPEPGTFVLLGLGLAFVWWRARSQASDVVS